MADELVRQSVFDRLIGADRVEEAVFPDEVAARLRPESKAAKAPRPIIQRRPARTWDESVAIMKRNVLRDLEHLLNTRQISDPARRPYQHLERSAYNYGLGRLVLLVQRIGQRWRAT